MGAGPAPVELLTYVMCKEIYHCTPSQLRKERVVDVMPHITVHERVLKHQEKMARRGK